mgnify:CR=1 FL=1
MEQGWLAAQSLVVDLTTDNERVVMLGRANAAYDIGRILGPTVAGAAASISVQLVPLGASALCAMGLVIVHTCIEDVPRAQARSPSNSAHHYSRAKSSATNILQDVWKACSQPPICWMILMKVRLGI